MTRGFPQLAVDERVQLLFAYFVSISPEQHCPILSLRSTALTYRTNIVLKEFRPLSNRLSQAGPTAADPRLHSTNRNPHSIRYLLISEPLEIAKGHREPLIAW